jgi:hypothetical protein
MPADNDKHAAQTAFAGAENIQELYQQILSEGHILIGGESLTQQIAQEFFPEIDQPDIQHEIGLEPER